jgi:hypothetical protein
MIDIIQDIIDNNRIGDTRLDNIYYIISGSMHNFHNTPFKIEGEVMEEIDTYDNEKLLTITDVELRGYESATVELAWFIENEHLITVVTEKQARLLLL